MRYFSSTRSIPRFASRLAGYENVWSVRINEQYRAIGERHGDTITWVWIGTHNEFDNLFG
jgi:plasmid maintenance system killer protein